MMTWKWLGIFGTSIELLETYSDGTISLAIGAPIAGTSLDDRFGYIYIVNMTDQARLFHLGMY